MLTLELEVLKLCKISPDNAVPKEAINGSKSTKSGMTRKKRTIDWTKKFCPGAPTNEFEKLELPDFVANFFYLWSKHMTPSARRLCSESQTFDDKGFKSFMDKHLQFSYSHHQTSWIALPEIWPWYVMMWRFFSSTQISNLLFLNNAQVHLLRADPLLAVVRPLIAVSVGTCTCAKVT